MVKNLVSQPPLTVNIADKNGILNRAWAIWFRDLYKRTSFKGGNTIDDNKSILDETNVNLSHTDTSLAETITTQDSLILNIESNTISIAEHKQEEIAHHSNGKIVGFDDTASETTLGLVKQMALVNDAITSIISVTVPSAGIAPAAYSQSYAQNIANLTNANKLAINSLVTEHNAVILVLNRLMANSKLSGQMNG